MAKKERLLIGFDDETIEKLDACAEKLGLSRSSLVRMFCLEGIERMESKPDFEKMTNGELMAELDDTMQELAKASHAEWVCHPYKSRIIALKKELSKRMRGAE